MSNYYAEAASASATAVVIVAESVSISAGRGTTTPTNDDGYNYSNNNNNHNNNNNNNNSSYYNTQNLNIKTRKKSSNKTNLRNLKRNEKFFKKFQQEIESSVNNNINNNYNNKTISTTSSLISSTTLSNINSTALTTGSLPLLLKSTSITVIPPPLISFKPTLKPESQHQQLTFADNNNNCLKNNNDLFDISPRNSIQMNAIKIKTIQTSTTALSSSNKHRISAIPIKTKNEKLPTNSTLFVQPAAPTTTTTTTITKDSKAKPEPIIDHALSLEDFNMPNNLSDEFESTDLKPVFSKSLANKIKNHYRSINNESVFTSLTDPQPADRIETNAKSNMITNNMVVPALINDKFFKNNNNKTNTNSTSMNAKPKVFNSKVRHSKSNSFESSSFLLQPQENNGFSSNMNSTRSNYVSKLKLPNKLKQL